jgi:hypothetical protein
MEKEKRKAGTVKMRSFNQVVGGGPWPQRHTIKEVLDLQKSLSWQLSNTIKAFKWYLQGAQKPHKGTVTKYENEISLKRRTIHQNSKVIQALNRYGLLNLDKNLVIPIIPYIIRAVEEEERLQKGRDRLRLSGAFESSQAQIDFLVQQLFAGFIEVNESVNRYYPGELPELLKSMHGYGELPELLKFIRGYGDRCKHPKSGDLDVSQYLTLEIIESYLVLLRAMYRDIFLSGERPEEAETVEDSPQGPFREPLRFVK